MSSRSNTQFSKTRVNLPKPSEKYSYDGKRVGSFWEVIFENISIGLKSMHSILVGLVLTLSGILIGLFTYPLTLLSVFSIKNILEALFKQTLPGFQIIFAVSVTGLILGFSFFSIRFEKDSPDPLTKISPLTKTLACLAIILIFDYFILNIKANELISGDYNLSNQVQLFFSQSITFLAILLFIPIYRFFTRKIHVSRNILSMTDNFKSIYLPIKFVVVFLTINIVIAYLATRNIELSLKSHLSSFAPIVLPYNIDTTLVGALFAGLIISSIFYWPRQSLKVNSYYKIIRLLLIIGGVVIIGYIYRFSGTVDGLIAAVIVSGCLVFLATPVQKVLS